MKQFTKIIETCKDCPNLTSGAMSKCLHDKKNPKEISSFLDTIEWLKDKENVKHPLTIPDWCPLEDVELYHYQYPKGNEKCYEK